MRTRKAQLNVKSQNEHLNIFFKLITNKFVYKNIYIYIIIIKHSFEKVYGKFSEYFKTFLYKYFIYKNFILIYFSM